MNKWINKWDRKVLTDKRMPILKNWKKNDGAEKVTI